MKKNSRNSQFLNIKYIVNSSNFCGIIIVLCAKKTGVKTNIKSKISKNHLSAKNAPNTGAFFLLKCV